MSSPAFNEKIFNKVQATDYADAGAMTVSGTINKTGILFLLMLSTAIVSWNLEGQGLGGILMISGLVVGLIVSLVIIFKRETAPTLAPVYALAEGLVLGSISAMYEVAKPGIAMNAMVSTFSCLALMLGLYHFRILQATPRFQKVMAVAMGAIVMTYICNMIAGFMGHPMAFINQGGTFGILFSVVVVGVAALNFIIDFTVIEQGAASRAPKYMEWYCAFGVLLTLVWLYLEILRLLSKLNNRR